MSTKIYRVQKFSSWKNPNAAFDNEIAGVFDTHDEAAELTRSLGHTEYFINVLTSSNKARIAKTSEVKSVTQIPIEYEYSVDDFFSDFGKKAVINSEVLKGNNDWIREVLKTAKK